MTEWTQAMRDRLVALWATNISASQIGREMRLSKNAVLGAVHRLKLPSRSNPIRAPRAEPKEPRKVKAIPLPGPKIAPEIAPVVRLSKSETCQWIFDEPSPQRTKFCNAPVPLGSSWCAHHRAIVFVQSDKGGHFSARQIGLSVPSCVVVGERGA